MTSAAVGGTSDEAAKRETVFSTEVRKLSALTPKFGAFAAQRAKISSMSASFPLKRGPPSGESGGLFKKLRRKGREG